VDCINDLIFGGFMTPREFANKYITPPARARYIKNITEMSEQGRDMWHCRIDNDYVQSPFEFIDCGFPWNESKEGRKYWRDVAEQLPKEVDL
jgi:hypothetical protein